ncbi:hypothetical protein [Pedobacter sp.]|uniref:hypothetical protein n=1 Tax=Pedobacter sp. TaxID=1411316 RepID=UPI0031E3EA0C
MKSNFKKALLLAMLCSGQAMAQQTINQVLTLNSNGVNSTEILMKKQDNASYYSLFSNDLSFGLYNSSTGKYLLYTDANDRVGIGTHTPLAKLHVNGVLRAMHSISGDNSAYFGNESSSGYGLFSTGGGGASNLYPFRFEKYTGAVVMMADGDGNVGIGIDNPLHILHLKKPQPTLNFEKTGILNWTVGNIAGNDFYIRVDNAPSSPFVMESNTGNVGIGTATPKEKLSVNGKIRAKEIKVEATNWPDYVFKPEYQLNTLPELEAYIKANGHLPEVPAAAEVEKEGVALGEMNKILLKKIEELTLHLIEKDKKLEETNRKLDKVMQMVETLTQKNK